MLEIHSPEGGPFYHYMTPNSPRKIAAHASASHVLIAGPPQSWRQTNLAEGDLRTVNSSHRLFEKPSPFCIKLCGPREPS